MSGGTVTDGCARTSPAVEVGASRTALVETEPPSPARSGQIEIATIAIAASARRTPAITATLLVIRGVPQGADQAGADHPDDQQRDAIEPDSSDVAVGPQVEPGVHDHVDRDRGEEAAEDQAEQQQSSPEIGIHFAQ